MRFFYLLLILMSFSYLVDADDSVKGRLKKVRMEEEISQQQNQEVHQNNTMTKGEYERLHKELQEKDRLFQMDFLDEQAKKTLFAMVEDCEFYAKRHEGKYPTDKNMDLGVISNICGIEHMGFKYECYLSVEQCEFKAIPIEPGKSGSKIFAIKTGEVKLE